MSTRECIKFAFLAWGVPVLIVLVALFATPDPNRERIDFHSTDLTAPFIAVSEHSGRRGSDYFQLSITEGDRSFYHRDPEREPIISLFERIPRNMSLRLTYDPSVEGNVLLDVRATEGAASPFLDFTTTMRDYSKRRHVIYWVAGIWFVLGSLLFYALSTGKVDQPSESKSEGDDKMSPEPEVRSR